VSWRLAQGAIRMATTSPRTRTSRCRRIGMTPTFHRPARRLPGARGACRPRRVVRLPATTSLVTRGAPRTAPILGVIANRQAKSTTCWTIRQRPGRTLDGLETIDATLPLPGGVSRTIAWQQIASRLSLCRRFRRLVYGPAAIDDGARSVSCSASVCRRDAVFSGSAQFPG
jgi:hypothetical protein